MRELTMSNVFDWAERQTDKFVVLPNGSICLKEADNGQKS